MNFVTPIVPINLAIKKKSQGPVDVAEVRRNGRLAGLSAGYNDKAAADVAIQKTIGPDAAPKTSKEISKMIKKNLNQQFEVEIIDNEALPSPELLISTIQSTGVEHCPIPPSEVSAEKLLANCA
jgi:hypothetical protein